MPDKETDSTNRKQGVHTNGNKAKQILIGQRVRRTDGIARKWKLWDSKEVDSGKQLISTLTLT